MHAVSYYVRIVHFILQKTNFIIIEARTVI